MFDARPFFRAVAELVAEDAELRRDLLVNLVGAKRGKYDGLLRDLGLDERVRYVGWVPHGQALRYLQQSDVLLMCQLTHEGGGSEKLSGKCFEYLYMRKPILNLSVPGLTAELLAESGLGTTVHPGDVAGIKATLRAFYARRGQPQRGDAAVVARFDRRRLTERLAAIFDELAGVHRRASVAA
jgi:glycosyltransferase involved in cell wall biosynthesis